MDTLTCRSCRDEFPRSAVQSWTVHEDDSDNDDGIAVLRVTVQCNSCLESDGPDAYCSEPVEDTRDAAYERANVEWGNSHGGHL